MPTAACDDCSKYGDEETVGPYALAQEWADAYACWFGINCAEDLAQYVPARKTPAAIRRGLYKAATSGYAKQLRLRPREVWRGVAGSYR